MRKRQNLNAYVEELPPDIEGQETALLPADEIMDIVYHFMFTTWENKMIEQGFNYSDSTIQGKTDLFETRVENLEPKAKKSSTFAKKLIYKKFTKKKKKEDSDSSVVESSEESSVESRPIKKYCTLYGKCSHSTDKCKDLYSYVNKHKQKKRRISRSTEREIMNSIL